MDVASARQMFATTLGSFSFKVTCVDSGEAALETLEQAPVDDPFRLVLMDYMMPGMDGIETSRRIKKSPRLSDVPTIIMVTAFSRDEVMNEAREARLEGFLTKPVTPSELLDTIVSTLVTKGGLTRERPPSTRWKIPPLENGRGAHVLLVEDNTINQLVAQDLLTQAGMQVTIADNGRQALELAGKNVFDLILMDIQMPEMDGFEVTRAIRGNPSLAQPPIIAMTAHAMSGDREKCLIAGMDDHVAKPIEPKVLFETLKKWMPVLDQEPVKPTPRLEEATDGSTILPSHLDGIDIENGLRRTGGNRRLYVDLLKLFVTDHGHDGRVITQALADNDIKLVQRTAHTLKGVAGGIGALALYTSAQHVETALQEGRSDGLKTLIEILIRDLEEVVDHLKTTVAPPPLSDMSTRTEKPWDRETMTILMDAFQKLADELDPDMEVKAKEINRLLHDHGSSHTALGDRLLDQAANLDFEEALETLARLREAIGSGQPSLSDDRHESEAEKPGDESHE